MIEQVIAQYATAQLRIKELEERQKPLKEDINQYLIDAGTQDEVKLHYNISFDTYIGDVKGITRMRKVSTKLDMDAAEPLLTSKGLYKRCIKMVPTVDEDALLAARYEGLLTDDDMREIFPQTESWSIVLDRAK